jgi:hypothetical protein
VISVSVVDRQGLPRGREPGVRGTLGVSKPTRKRKEILVEQEQQHVGIEATLSEPGLAAHARRRTSTNNGEPGRTPGGGSSVQRGWPNPDSQLFGQVTSRTHHRQLYDPPIGRLTKHRGTPGSAEVPLRVAIGYDRTYGQV